MSKSVEMAMKVLANAINNDPGYAIAWQANIAMGVFDVLPEEHKTDELHKACNEGAITFMGRAFGYSEPVDEDLLALTTGEMEEPVEVDSQPSTPGGGSWELKTVEFGQRVGEFEVSLAEDDYEEKRLPVMFYSLYRAEDELFQLHITNDEDRCPLAILRDISPDALHLMHGLEENVGNGEDVYVTREFIEEITGESPIFATISAVEPDGELSSEEMDEKMVEWRNRIANAMRLPKDLL